MNILLISGHGFGDPGATSNINGVLYKEADETRRVTAALKKQLDKYCNVTIYPTNRNAFIDNKNGTLSKNANFKAYDYVLEIHFNAFNNSTSDGRTKGVECFVTKSEKTTNLENKICSYISSVGLTNRGVKRNNFSVINTARKSGISSALLEVCFIDDPDDMKIYISKFNEIVNSITKAIIEVYKLKKENELEKEEMIIYKTLNDIPKDFKPTVEKLISKGYIKGNGNGELNLEHNMLRVLVINDRAGCYDN